MNIIKRKIMCFMVSFYKRFSQWYTNSKLFWVLVITISCWNMSSIFLLMLKRYLSDSISISVETSFLHWNHTFPAISICLSKSRSNSEIIKFVKQKNINYIKNIHNYLFITPTNINTKEDYCRGYNSTCGINVNVAREQLLTRFCDSIISNITFLEVEQQSCEKIFTFHDLEMGYCFLANNIMDHKHLDELPLKFSTFGERNSLRMFLKQESLWKYEMYVHSNEDIPYFGLLSQTLGQDHKKYIYNMEDIQNSVDVADESFKKRKCKFPKEVIYGSSYPYSFSSCMSDLRIVLELKICGCTLFTSPKKFFNFYCNITGMTCISKGKLCSVKTYIRIYYDTIQNRYTPKALNKLINKVLKTRKFSKAATENLNKNLLFEWSIDIQNIYRPNFLLVDIEIQNIPSLRCIRSVTQTHQDLVVSAGGVIGLFVGTSILSGIEIAYLCLKRL